MTAHLDVFRRMDRHRKFPTGTCPASRHAAMIAKDMAKGRAPEELDHAAESIASTVGSLWQARNKLHDLGYKWKNGRWVKAN